MAANLLESGYDVLAWNRTLDKAKRLADDHGAKVAASPVDLAECDVVVLMLLAADHVRDVLFGPDGVLTGERVPRVVVNMSTVEVPAAEDIAARCAERGSIYLAAPVSGSTHFARAGKLTIIASGEQESFQAVRPLLETLGQRVIYTGGGVEAHLIKLAVNMVIGATNAALAEALALVVKGGVGESAYLEVLNESVIASPWIAYKTQQLIEHDYTPGHTLRGLDKDYRLMAATAEAAEVPLPVTSFVHQQIRAAIGWGDGEADMTGLVKRAFLDAGLKP
jgi:3-hydroxyisobutyrate dehydrogenase-like beta-hydroxyacid dehydrogenase